MENYIYLLVNILVISIPFFASFGPRMQFYKIWPSLFKAISITLLGFILWDVVFTTIGVWGFNEKYLIGVYFYGLPLEEYLFFITIPYACVFTFQSIQVLVKENFPNKYVNYLNTIISVGSLIIAFYFWGRWYTCMTFMLLGIYLLFHLLFLKKTYMGSFYLSYLIIQIPFFIFNGILTGSWIAEEVVWYNDQENMGIRLGTIPVEDVFYGMLLILINVDLFEYFKAKSLK